MSPMSVRPEIHFDDTELARYVNLANHVFDNISKSQMIVGVTFVIVGSTLQ